MSRKRDLIKQFKIFFLTLFINLVLLFLILSGTNVDKHGHIIKKKGIIQQSKFFLKNLNHKTIKHKNPEKPAILYSTFTDSSETDANYIVQVDYFIIVGSFGNQMQAQQKADKINGDFDTNTIILPPTKEGYYRISYGKYSTLEEAKAKIQSIRTNINPEAWILSVKE